MKCALCGRRLGGETEAVPMHVTVNGVPAVIDLGCVANLRISGSRVVVRYHW